MLKKYNGFHRCGTFHIKKTAAYQAAALGPALILPILQAVPVRSVSRAASALSPLAITLAAVSPFDLVKPACALPAAEPAGNPLGMIGAVILALALLVSQVNRIRGPDLRQE